MTASCVGARLRGTFGSLFLDAASVARFVRSEDDAEQFRVSVKRNEEKHIVPASHGRNESIGITKQHSLSLIPIENESWLFCDYYPQ